MTMQAYGVINGKQIELERETGLPSGSAVMLEIYPAPLTLSEKRELADQLCGSWSNDDSLRVIFAEIEQQRAATKPREVSFDASS